MKLSPDARGVYAIAPTPFAPDGAIDRDSLHRMCDFYLKAGVTGITVLGQLGEAPKLEAAESLTIVAEVVRRMPVPVVVGVTAPGFAAMRALARDSMDAGAAGVMIAPPNTLRTDDQIVGYYRQAVEAIGTDIPFVIQDYPLTFSVVMSPGVIGRIITENPSCVMLKHEDWPGHGAMTGYCFPEMLVGVTELNAAGQRDAAHDLFDAHLPLVRYEQQPGVGLAVRKYVMMRRGVLASDAQRRPAAPLTPATRAEVDYLLDRLEKRYPWKHSTVW
ncbi:MAG: dihydrodipicolinate synthase family protein [Burkholderiales bacterium]|nr:dihydrodipicolinate synthase family protein [Burkholderiales bacterium]